MAATDYKISVADVQGAHVEAQPTILRGSATQNKKVFDKYCDMIVDHFNDLCDFVDADTSAEIAYSVKQLYINLGWVAD